MMSVVPRGRGAGKAPARPPRPPAAAAAAADPIVEYVGSSGEEGDATTTQQSRKRRRVEGAAAAAGAEDTAATAAAASSASAASTSASSGPRFNLKPCHSDIRGHDRRGARPVITSLFVVRAAPPKMAKQSVKPRIALVRATGTHKMQHFLLEGNIINVFTKSLKEGKALIRLRSPPQDIAISKAEPQELSEFLTTLYTVHTQPESLARVPAKSMVMATLITPAKLAQDHQRVLVIDEDRELPRAFQPGLRSLSILGHSLTAVAENMRTLKHLRKLDLSHNRFRAIDLRPEDLPNLTSVHLAHNELVEVPLFVLSSRIRVLDLSHNQIQRVPKRLYKLRGVNALNLSHNQITVIPPYLHFLKALQDLRLNHNRLANLPGDIVWLPKASLKRLDLQGNPFSDLGAPKELPPAVLALGPHTLKEIAARAVLASKLSPPKAELPGALGDYLGSTAARCCTCKRALFDTSAQFVRATDLSPLAEAFTQLASGTTVPLLFRVCSWKCARTTRF